MLNSHDTHTYTNAVQHQIPHNAVDSLLKILYPIYPELPKDSRTLLNTPVHIEVSDLDTGKFVYLGLLSEIQKRIKLFSLSSNKEIRLSFNIDGLPLFKYLCIQFNAHELHTNDSYTYVVPMSKI